jgi:hypothetical protein
MTEEQIIATLFEGPIKIDLDIPLVEYEAYKEPDAGRCPLDYCYRQLVSNGNLYFGYPEKITYMKSREELPLIVLRLIYNL